jgi:hypothetical protein
LNFQKDFMEGTSPSMIMPLAGTAFIDLKSASQISYILIDVYDPDEVEWKYSSFLAGCEKNFLNSPSIEPIWGKLPLN